MKFTRLALTQFNIKAKTKLTQVLVKLEWINLVDCSKFNGNFNLRSANPL
jgi:hypothetical protein